MATVPTLVQESVAPGPSLAIDRALLARAGAERRAFLRVHAWPGDVLLLGRHHRGPASAAVHRRLSGGRVVPAGTGFVQIALALPHRSALEADDPHALRAEQVLNRAVRGVLGGLELLGLEAYYPGRDLVTVGGKPIGWIALTVEAGGATLVEGGLAVERDFAVLASLADRLDPTGLAAVTLWQADDVTSVARECDGAAPAGPAVMAAIVEGYRRRLGWQIEMDASLADVAAAEDAVAFDVAADLDRCGRRAVMLGTLMAYVRLAADGTLAAVRLAGDVMAPVATMRAIEQALGGLAPARAALLAAVSRVLADPAHFLLGATAEDIAGAVLAGAVR
jgi:lipoate-protein ligase A